MAMTFKQACEAITLREMGAESRDDLTEDGVRAFEERFRSVATSRQESKWRNGYGRAALEAGRNTREQPRRRAA